MSSVRNERQRAQRSSAASPERRAAGEVLTRCAPLLCVVGAMAVAWVALIPSLAAAGWRPSVLVRH